MPANAAVCALLSVMQSGERRTYLQPLVLTQKTRPGAISAMGEIGIL
jgi:hypothetical protein